MTIEELCDCPADRWESLTDEQLLALAKEKGWDKITRPELANPEGKKAQASKPVVNGSTAKPTRPEISDEKKRQAAEIAKGLGIDLGGLFKL